MKIDIFHQISAIISLNIFLLCHSLCLLILGIYIKLLLDLLIIVSQVTGTLFTFFFFPVSPTFSDWIISSMFSDSSSFNSSLLLSTSTEFFILMLFSSRFPIFFWILYWDFQSQFIIHYEHSFNSNFKVLVWSGPTSRFFWG